MNEIKFVDTTIRDGQASLWAMNMRTRHMLAAMPYLDAAGFESMEFIATGSRLKKFVRHLNENPWDWIKLGAAAAKNTPLLMPKLSTRLYPMLCFQNMRPAVGIVACFLAAMY